MKTKTTIGKVRFVEKSAWQPDDCISRSADYQCPNKVTLEAVYGGRVNMRVRCCKDKRCKTYAAKLARLSGLGGP